MPKHMASGGDNTEPSLRIALSPPPMARSTAALLAVAPPHSAAAINLRPHSRLNPEDVAHDEFVLVQEGMFALEAIPPGGRRQVLDFFVSGDIIPFSSTVFLPAFYLRTIARGSLIPRRLTGIECATDLPLRGPEVMAHFKAHLGRRNLTQIMIGQLAAEARVATFILALAHRTAAEVADAMTLALPMSRDDIADHLAMNPDTLSRVMMRLETLGITRRQSRHCIVIEDVDELGRMTPLRRQLLGLLAGGPAATNGRL